MGLQPAPDGFPVPDDEEARLAALRGLRLADYLPDPTFDRITDLAAQVFGVPIALVSLIDDTRQWFKSAHGLDLRYGPREIAFCAHAIMNDDPLVVEDLSADPRFSANPYVVGNGLRFYAGLAIHDKTRHRVGAFAVLDWSARSFTSHDLDLLRRFGSWAESEIQRGGEAYGRLFEEVPVGMWEEDFSPVVPWLNDLRVREGDLRTYLEEHPDELTEAVRLVRVIDVNSRGVALMDAASKAEILDVTHREPLSEGGRRSFIDRFLAIAEGSGAVTGDYTWISNQGRPISCHIEWIVPHRDGDFDYSRALLVSVDMTPVVQAEAARVESESRHQELVENLPLGMIITSPEGEILDANPAAQQMLKAPDREALLSTPVVELWRTPADRDLFLRALSENETVVQSMVEVRTLDGSPMLARTITRGVKSPAGQLLYIESLVEDITDRYQIEQRLARMAEILEHTSDLVSIANWEGTGLYYLNPMARKSLGIAPDADLTRVAVLSFYDPTTRGRFAAEIIPSLLERDIWEGELEVRRADGSHFPTSQVIVAHRDKSNRITHVSTVARDLSEYRRAEAEATRSRDRLAEVVKSKDQFLASISHEIRTPLSVVVGLAYELAEHLGSFSNTEIAELTGHIYAQSTEMAQIVEDLLVAARADTGTLKSHAHSIDLRSLVEKLVTDMNPILDDRRIEVVGDPTQAWADPYRVRQIVRNLITNAIRYGGSTIRILIHRHHPWARISVEDNGTGIPEGLEELIFEPYARAHESRGRPGSVGLGLSVSRTLARLMRGDLTYRREAEMSAFDLTLPAEPLAPGSRVQS